MDDFEMVYDEINALLKRYFRTFTVDLTSDDDECRLRVEARQLITSPETATPSKSETAMPKWKEVEGFMPDGDAIHLECVARGLRPGAKVLELGSWMGKSACAIAGSLPDGATLYCVDHFLGSVEHQCLQVSQADLIAKFLKNTEDYKEKIVALIMSSRQALDLFSDGSLDMVFIDGSHDLASITADLAWAKKVKPGGHLLAHDYMASWPDVTKALKESGINGHLHGDSIWHARI